MKRAEILTAVGLLVVAGLVMQQSVRLGPGWGDAGPRAGFFPFWLSVVLGLSALWVLGGSLRRSDATPFFPPGAARLVLTVFLPMAGAFVLFEVVGFYVAAFAYLLVYPRLAGRLSWAIIIAVAVLFPVATFVVFERWFLIPLPKGLFGEQILPF